MKRTQLAVLSSFLFALSACGSSASPVDETHEGELTDSDPRIEQDNSPYDTYEVTLGPQWVVTVDMVSENFDTYLHIVDPNGDQVAQNDDGPNGTNAQITFTAPSAGTYKVLANSYNGEGRGAYSVHIVSHAP